MNLNDKKTKKVVAGIVAGAMGMNIVPAMMPVVDSDLAGMFGVRAAEAAVPTELARNVAFTDTDTNGGQIAGNVTWEAAANESNITDYVVYYLNASDQKVGEAIGTVAKGGTYSVTINVDTAIPTGATQIGVFSKNTEGESATAAKVAIVDDKSGDANNAPTVTNPINDITGTAGGEAVTIDASGTFEDQDGDSLTLTAASSDESIATVTVNGTDIVVTPVAEGTATITVTADDGNGGKVNTTFDIVVSAAPAPANNAPTVANPINDITGTAGGEAVTIDASGTFEDQDGDSLTLTAASSDESIATVTVNGTDIVVTPVAEGTATITVTADDGNGGKVNTTFDIVVSAAPAPANNAPTVANPINDITGTAGGEAVTIDASGTFEDQDGDSLTLTAASSDESIATVTVNGTDIVVTPVAEGTATITVTADDGNGGTVKTTFDIVVSNAPTTGDGTGEDGTTGDDTTGDDTAGDDTTGDGTGEDGTTGDDTTGDGTGEDGTTGDGTTGDDTTGDGTGEDGTTGDDTTGDGTGEDGTTGDGTTGDDTTGDGTGEDGTTGDDTTGDGTGEDGTTGDDTTGDGTGEDGTTGDGTTGDDTTGDGTGEDGTTGDDTTGDDTAGDDTTGDGTGEDGTTGDDTTGDGTGEDGTTGDDTTGDDTAGDGTTGDDTAGDDTKPFSITAKGDLDRSSGIKATVNVDRISAASDHDGNEVVIFQLMKGNEPVSIVALEKDIQSPEGLTAHFNVDGSDNNYWVKVFVFDEFNSDTNSVQTNLAQALELGKN